MSKHILPGAAPTFISNCYPPSTAEPGAVRFNSGTQCLQIFDGSSWHDFRLSEPTLSWEAEKAIDKMIEIIDGPMLDELANKYPLVAEALGQLEVALKLCQNNETEKS